MLTIRYATSDYLCHDPDCALCSADADYGEPLGHYRCQCCGEEDPELFMLRDDLWRRITGNQPELLLCWRCAESALGRPILPADLTKCPLDTLRRAFDFAHMPPNFDSLLLERTLRTFRVAYKANCFELQGCN